MKVKNIIGGMMLVISVMLVILILTGRLEHTFQTVKNKMIVQRTDSAGKSDKVTDEKNGEASAHSYPEPGIVIENYPDAFEWESSPPDIQVYDPDPTHKNVIYGVYGRTKAEASHFQKIYDAFDNTISHMSIEERFRGENKYNCDSLVAPNETFELPFYQIKVTYEDIEILDRLDEVQDCFFLPEVIEEDLENWYHKDGTLCEGVELLEPATGHLLADQQLKFIRATIRVHADSDWVQEISYIAPLIEFYDSNEDYLQNNPLFPVPYLAKKGDSIAGFSEGYPIYIDLGFYNYNNDQCRNMNQAYIRYVMRKDEEITFHVIYVCPESCLDRVYLTYGKEFSTGQYCYYVPWYKILKVQEERK